MKKILLTLFIVESMNLYSQNGRVNDFNYVNWLQSINTVDLNRKWNLHTEYQWRRTNGFKNWQQSLLRIGVNFKLNENIVSHAGYAWIKTFSYGQYPIAAGNSFPEHRTYEQLSMRHQDRRWSFIHRFRIEQRWLAKFKPGTNEIEDWIFLHRFRYQFRTQYSVWKHKDKQVYSVFADEIFIGAGEGLGENIFDQNRLFLLAGIKFNNTFIV